MDADVKMSRQQWLVLKDRALAAAAEGITIVDARLPGRPLIYVNDGFERLTGYSAAESLGRNCRFLQGPDSEPGAVDHIRQSLQQEKGCTVEILNYRKDGTTFWNRLSITPVRDADGELTHFIGIQSDVTRRRLAEHALRRANLKLKEANSAMQRDLAEAAVIQQAWLPQSLPEVPGYRFAWSFIPCQELGGDSLNVLHLDRNHVGLYVLDVTGHGVGAALLSASIQRWLSPVPEHSCLFTGTAGPQGTSTVASPAAVAAELNRRFRAEPESGKFLTLVYGVLDLTDGRFRYATAGHPPPLLLRSERAEACPLAAGVPIGVLEDFPYEERVLHLEPGDRLLLYTDGAPESTGPDEQHFGTERIRRAMERLRGSPTDDVLGILMEDLRGWVGAEVLADDVTLLMVEATADQCTTRLPPS